MADMLQLSGVSSGYGEAMVLQALDLSVPRGAIVALLGKNGMGKTTLLKTAMGYLRKRSGRVTLDGVDITLEPVHRIVRRGVAYAAQEQALFGDLGIRDNLRLGLERDAPLDERLPDILQMFPFLKGRDAQRAGTLSGGEQKMLLVARALLARPALLLVDEITEGLQPSVVDRVAAALRQQRERFGTTILLVEQNVEFALAVADRYAVLKRGTIVVEGATANPGASETIREQLRV